MSKSIATINVSSDTFQTLIAQVNTALDLLATEVVTANNEANGALTTGNGYVNGTMSALVFAANTMRGGNVQSSQTLNITSNLNLTGNTLSIGNSTVNTVVNSSIIKIANSSVSFNITKPEAGFVTAGNYALLANGVWQKIIASPNNEFYISANVYFQQNTVFNATTTTFNSNVVFNSDFSVSTIDATSANLNGAVVTGNSTYLIVTKNLSVNGDVSYKNIAVNGYSISANVTVVDLGPKIKANNAMIGPNTSAYTTERFMVSDGNMRIHSSNNTAEIALKFSRSGGQVAYIGSPTSDPDALYFYGPNAAATGTELAATYTQENWTFYTGGASRLTLDENGRVGIGNSNPSKHLVVQGSDPTVRIQIANGSTVDLIHSSLSHDFTLGVSGAGGNSTGIALRASSNGNIHLLEHAAGNVSVGSTLTSNAKMTIYGSTKLLNMVGNTGSDKDVIHITDTLSLRSFVLRDSAVNDAWIFRAALANGGVDWLAFTDTGRVGVRTANPSAIFHVNGNSVLGGITTVTGAATLQSTLTVSGATNLSSTLGVTRAATFANTVSVTGAVTLSSTLAVSGATTLSNTLGVTRAATFSNTVTVTGAATFNGNAYDDGNNPTSSSQLTNKQYVDAQIAAIPSGLTLLANNVAMSIFTTEITGIPSDAKRVILVIDNAFNSRGTRLILGDSGGLETNDYNQYGLSASSGFNLGGSNITVEGIVELMRNGSTNEWHMSSVIRNNTSAVPTIGNKTLTGALSQIKLDSTVSSPLEFSSGTVSAWYE